MKRKIIGIVVCMLLMTTVGLPSITGQTSQKNDTPQLNEPQPAPLTDWWPMYGHDSSHSRYSTSTAPNTADVLWKYNIGTTVARSSPAVVDGKVYIGSQNHNVYCFNAATGTKIWIYNTGDTVWSGPAVANGKVYVGTFAGKVYCLNAATGGLVWSYTVNNEVFWGSPVVADGKVYIGGNVWGVFCLDAATGGLVWFHQIINGLFGSSPAVADGKVYIGAFDHKVYCLNAATGGFIWSYTTGDTVDSTPSVNNGKVYVGSRDKKVYCLKADTGGLLWSYTTGDVVTSSPAIANGKVYIGSDKVYCLNADTGGLLWSYATSMLYSAPAVADGKVYIGGGYIRCLDAATGAQLWWFHAHTVDSAPAVADGKVYIGGDQSSTERYVYCFGSQQQNNPPNKPQKPTGPTTRVTGQQGTYWANGTDPDGDKIQYRFDWNASGSHSYSAWTSLVNSGTKLSMVHSWTKAGTYVVKVQSRDEHGALSVWSNGLTVTVTVNHPPNQPKKPTGPTTRLVGQSGTYWANGTDPDGDKIQYRFDWDAAGAHQYSSWTSLVNSGTKVSKTHAWTSPGTYVVKVQSRDEHGVKSVWSNGLTVIVHT